jgi:selenide,water dikinase
VPTLEEAWEFIRKGKIPAATHANLKYVHPHTRYEKGLKRVISLMLADPQTAGGLLIAVPADKTERLIGRLKELKTPAASCIHETIPPPSSGNCSPLRNYRSCSE